MQEILLILAITGVLAGAEPAPRPADLDRYQLHPLPPPLEARRGVHPRLFFDAKQVAQLRVAITSTHVPLWKEVLDQADRSAKTGPRAYLQHDSYSGDEQLWQREVGNAMPPLAMAWLLTGQSVPIGATPWRCPGRRRMQRLCE